MEDKETRGTLKTLTEAETEHVVGGALHVQGPGNSEPGGGATPPNDNFYYANQNGKEVGKPYP